MKQFLFLFFIAQCYIACGQTFDFSIDHSSLIVTDLKATGDFYADVLQLEEIPHPDNSPGFRWFLIHGNTQLHLIQKDTVPIKKHKSMHLCLSTQKLKAFIDHLENHKIPYEDWPGKKNAITLRTDGVQQIYLQDPEGYWIEINTAKHP